MPYSQYSLAQLQSMLLVDRLNNAVFWTTAEAAVYINEALCLWQYLTGMWKVGKPDVVKTTIGTNFYSVPAGMLSVMRMEFNEIPTNQVSLFEMDWGTPDWQVQKTSAAAPKVLNWFPSGLTEIGIHPADYVNDNDLGFVGIANPPVLVNGTDKIDLGEEDLKAILDAAQNFALFKIGGGEFQTSMGLLKNFIATAAKRNSRIAATSFYKRIMGSDVGRKLNPATEKTAEQIGAR